MKRNNIKRRSRRHGSRRNQKQDSKKLALLTGTIAALGLGAGGYVMTQYMSIEKPDANYCYIRADQQKVAVFVDNSLSNLSKAQLRDYRTGFKRAYDLAEPNALVSVFTTASDTNGSVVKPAFIMCKPASTVYEQEAIGAPSKPVPYLTRQSEEASERYNSEIERVLKDVQDNSKLAGDSPIIEQLSAISKHRNFFGKNRHFTVITDGVQNSELARFCAVKGDMPSFETFSKRSEYQLSFDPDSFEGANISLLLVEVGELPAPNMPYCSNHEVRNWWVSYFNQNGANSVDLTPLRYWAGAK